MGRGWYWACETIQNWYKTSSNEVVTKRKISIDSSSNSIYDYDDPNHCVRPPARGKAGGKKFVLNINGEIITIKAQKSLTIQAICTWVKTWASPETKIITPGNRLLSLDGDKLAHQAHFVYFILNEDSKAIKIGRAKNLENRIKSLQTSSPTQLKLIKSIQVESGEKAQQLEQSLHQKFQEIRLAGEWFKIREDLLNYIEQI